MIHLDMLKINKGNLTKVVRNVKDIIMSRYSKTEVCLFLQKKKIIILRVDLQYYSKHKEDLVFWICFFSTFRSPFYFTFTQLNADLYGRH